MSGNGNIMRKNNRNSFSSSNSRNQAQNEGKALRHTVKSFPADRRFTGPSHTTFQNQRIETGPNKEQRKPIFGYRKMKELCNKGNNEILFTLCMANNGFEELLETVGEKRDVMALTLINLGKASTSSYNTSISFLMDIIEKKVLVFYYMQLYLANFAVSQNQNYHLESLYWLSVFLVAYNKFKSIAQLLPVTIPLFEKTCRKVFQSTSDMLEAILKNLKDIENSHNRLDDPLPPENFRVIPILPNEKDIWDDEPFLRPNVVNGKYSDAEHYLDVQFRLLREDYVRPFREGIKAFLELKKEHRPLSDCTDVRIYENVRVIKQDFCDGDLIHVILCDVKKFSKVNWEQSRQFLSGSLLCLSPDGFKTMFFATVALRSCENLRKGILVLQFEDLSCEVLSINPNQRFTMIETTAYFEAYRHNLAALQTMTDYCFPLKNYVIDLQQNVIGPRYLQKTSTYDMAPFLKQQNSASASSPLKRFVRQITRVFQKEKTFASVKILKDDCWPTHENFGLNESQYLALKTALTKEFAIIQGPPGTGKTFVGLKIVQLLLHNRLMWDQVYDKRYPILVVCYTNHALDQFLEGIKSFTRAIIRVGGRCANEALAEFQLSRVRQLGRQKQQVPHHIYCSIRNQYKVLDDLKSEISSVIKEIDNSLNFILCDEILQAYMEDYHFHSLKSKKSVEKRNYAGNAIENWLTVNVSDSVAVKDSKKAHKTIAKEVTDSTSTPFTRPLKPITLSDYLPQSMVKEYGNASFQPEVTDVYSEENFDTEFVEGLRAVDTEDLSLFVATKNFTAETSASLEANVDNREQNNVNKKTQYIIEQLNKTTPLNESDAKCITDVWTLTQRKRLQLYKYWQQNYLKEKQEASLQLQLQIRNEMEKLKEMKVEEDLFFLRNAFVVGMTTTGAAKYRNLVLNMKPKIVVVEEAAEVLEAHIVTSLTHDTQHLILIGDHQQLRPSPNIYELAVKFNLNVSLFERMVENGMPYCQLMTQHRMRPSIAALLVPHIYANLKNDRSVYEFEDVLGMSKNVYFISHDIMEDDVEHGSKTKVNEHEAKFMIQLSEYLLLQGYDPSQITILTAYAGQQVAIKKYAKSDAINKVRITVVDNYQGEENDIILVSFVRSNDEGNIGFLKISNRVCVALSRARKGLFCIGNFNLFWEKSSLWKNILQELNKQDAIGYTLPLKCQIHDVITEVATDEDFSKVVEGGCMEVCNYLLECGHLCVKNCHLIDREHKNIKCQNPCSSVCESGHKCKLMCGETCGPCTVLIDKVLPACGHTIPVPCHITTSDVPCTVSCVKVLPCGHQCQKCCGEVCEPQVCKSQVPIDLLCGHKISVPCYDSQNLEKYTYFCTEPCATVLDCGHTCKGSCSSCHQGKLHEPCRKQCRRILICGHECESLCCNKCPPCQKDCENGCVHLQCSKMCGEPCTICMERCWFSCKHQACNNLCGLQCSQDTCNAPCDKFLECNHKCIGMCGDPCPSLCAVCHKKQVNQISPKSDAMFLMLEDCGHIFELQYLTEWITKSCNGRIQMKSCPTCKKPIRRNTHFRNEIKSCLLGIEKVKRIVYGNIHKNNAKKQLLVKQLEDLTISTNCESLNPMLLFLKDKDTADANIARADNTIRIAEKFIVLQNDVLNCDFMCDAISFKLTKTYHTDISKLLQSISQTGDILLDFIKCRYSTAMQQQFRDVIWEVRRFQLQHKFLRFCADYSPRDTFLFVPHGVQIVGCLCKSGAFCERDEQMFDYTFKEFCCANNVEVFDSIKEEEKINLVDFDLSQGRWYQCSKGHVYCAANQDNGTGDINCDECEQQNW